MTKREAAEKWVSGFNAIPHSIFDALWTHVGGHEGDGWNEVTKPCVGDRIGFIPEAVAAIFSGEVTGTDGQGLYQITLDEHIEQLHHSGSVFYVAEDAIHVERDSQLPKCETMWSFGDSHDVDWLKESGSLQRMSECGFRVYEHSEFGYFFGVDGGDYDLYERHWTPLYEARGLQLHDSNLETGQEIDNKALVDKFPNDTVNVTAVEYAETSTWRQENDQRYKDLTDKLETGMKELFSSDKYKEYLNSMSKFHNYSSRNIMLIKQQMPGATRVASFKLWDEGFNRKVKWGEKSLRIFAPIKTEQKKKLMEKLDPETGAPMLDENGKTIMEEMTALNSGGIKFKLVPVFDVSQTYGEPLPELVEDLIGNVEHYEAFIDTLKAVSPLPIVFEPMNENQDGYCRYGDKIAIREGMSEVQTVSAIVHEITHAKLHDKNNLTAVNQPKSKEVKEIEAESISYVVCQKYGIETGANSFGYLATWGSHDMKEIQASLDAIRKEANTLINAIDSRFAIVCKERGIDLTAAEQTQPESTTENVSEVDFSFDEVKPVMPEQRTDTLEHRNYEKLAELFPQIESGEYSYLRLEAGAGMTPLSVEWIGENQLSIMHTYTQNSDLMYDPMIVLEIDEKNKTATAVEFEQSNPPLFQKIDDGVGYSVDGNGSHRTIDNLQGQLNDFVSEWFENISNQGYLPERANVEINGEEMQITFDKDGNPIMPEPDSPQQIAEPLPDTTITPADRDAFGYIAEGMLPLNADRAVELFDEGNVIYMLYPDNTEAMVFDSAEIMTHDGMFGIERDDWVNSAEYKALEPHEPSFLSVERQSEQTVPPVEQSDVEYKEAPPINASETPTPPADSSAPETPSNETSYIHTTGVPIYKCSHELAFQNDEMEAYWSSYRVNVACGKAIDKAISENNYELHRYDLKTAARDVIAEFGVDRVEWILATNLQDYYHDERLSDSNREWARTFAVYSSPDYYLETHLSVLNGFIDRFREVQNEKPSLMADLKAGEEKSRAEFGNKQPQEKSAQKSNKRQGEEL